MGSWLESGPHEGRQCCGIQSPSAGIEEASLDEAFPVPECRATSKVGEMRGVGLCYRRGGLIILAMMRVAEAEVKEEVLRLSVCFPR